MLEVSHLYKAYDGEHGSKGDKKPENRVFAVNDVSFTVEDGEIGRAHV